MRIVGGVARSGVGRGVTGPCMYRPWAAANEADECGADSLMIQRRQGGLIPQRVKEISSKVISQHTMRGCTKIIIFLISPFLYAGTGLL